MNWLTEFVRPKIQAMMGKPVHEVPEDLWRKCSQCDQMIFHRDLATSYNVCPNCGHHFKLSTVERCNLLFDDQSYQILPVPKVPSDPLKFKDSKRYTDRLQENRSRTGQEDAMTTVHGKIKGIPAVAAIMSFDFMGGSMGLAVGRTFCAAAEWAIVQQMPLVAITASGGARMQEGLFSLMQMSTTAMAVEALRTHHIPYIVVLTDPTMGGVSASFAMLGDITIAETGALIGFAGPRVIEETIKQKLPEGFQRAEFLQQHGVVDIVCDRRELKGTIGRLLSVLTHAAGD